MSSRSRSPVPDPCCDQSWVSPALMVRRSRSFSEVRTIGNQIFWLERRPEEKGRSVVMAYDPSGYCQDLTPPDSDVGTHVHEYGGGAWALHLTPSGPEVVYSDRKKGGLWRSLAGGSAVPCAPSHSSSEDYRYADLALQDHDVFCVREVHAEGRVFSDLVVVRQDGQVQVLIQEADFYAAPRPSPDECWLAWIEWDNPYMPWTQTRLCVAPLVGHGIINAQKTVLEGGQDPCSVMEPLWDEDRLYAVSDRSVTHHKRQWTPIAFQREQEEWHAVELPPAPAETGLPHWVFGQRSLALLPDGALLARGMKQGTACLLHYHPHSSQCHDGWKEITCAGTPENVPQSLASGHYAWLDVPADAPPALAVGPLEGPVERFRNAWTLPENVTLQDIALPRRIQVPVAEGPSPIHALFYSPARGPHCVVPDPLPPLVVIVHGGPTGQAQEALSFKVQWWTSRGFAVLDVNYRGSTGFGRAYRDALSGQWGLRDVQDCCDAVQFVVEKGWVDPARCVIRGSSAGGLTVLSALARSDLFVAGTSLYGVTDLRGLVTDTHRFEAHYLEELVAPWPEGETVYDARSPVNWPEKIKVPVLFLHGENDKVVPLTQAEALCQRLHHAVLHTYPEEGHGFRAPDVQADALCRELAFYRTIFARQEQD